jgi:hypothetical protein
MEYDYYNKNDSPNKKAPAAELNGLSDLLFLDSQPPSYFETTRTGSIKITNFGQIKSFTLPKDWQPQPARAPFVGEPTNIKFTSANDGSLLLQEKGHRVSETAGALFTKALKQPLDSKTGERRIDLQTEQWQALKPILAEDLANRNKFNPELARIRTIGGRQILEVIGSRGYRDDKAGWINSDQMICSIYIDKFGKGDAIQEIRLEADKKSFQPLQRELEQALKAIQWRDIAVSTGQ